MKWVIVTGFLVTLIRFGGGKVLASSLAVKRAADENTKAPNDVDVTTDSISNKRDMLSPPLKLRNVVEEVNKNDARRFYHQLVKRAVCKPNQVFQSECNSCKCSPDGQHYTCTQNECLEKDMTKEVEVFMESEGTDHIERHSVCRPQDIFYIGCNTCKCNFYGTDYSCTNKPCPLPEDVELFHELKDMKPIIPYKEDDINRQRNPRYSEN